MIFTENFTNQNQFGSGGSNFNNYDLTGNKSNFYTSDINNNNNNNNHHRNIQDNQQYISRSNWPLKTINQSQNGYEYNCIFNFLNTNSLLWLSIFKLESIGALFSLNCTNLPVSFYLYIIK